jgi:glutamate dehydrogenase
MGQFADQRKTQILLDLEQRAKGDFGTFAKLFYSGLAVADLAARTPEALLEGVKSVWDFAADRKQGEPKVRVFRPEGAWAAAPLVVEIVNDDMPFLVDSISSALDRYDLNLELLIHPVVKVTRDSSGKRTGVDEGTSESVMQITASGAIDDAELPNIVQALKDVLKDVRAAVTDWKAMLHKLSLISAELDDPILTRTTVGAAEIAGTKDFLRWLADDHFTFLGFREYIYDQDGGQAVMKVDDTAGLGVLRDQAFSIFDGVRTLSELPVEVAAFLQAPQLLMVTKANRRSTVHRTVHLDVIGIKKLDADGRVVAERRFVGLFTSSVYNQSPTEIPMVAGKIRYVFEKAGYAPNSHNEKALVQILETYPRNELFQIPAEELYEQVQGILQLQDRKRIALFVWRDPFRRFVSCLVYVPADRYDSNLRERFHELLAEAYGGRVSNSYILLNETPLARLHIILGTKRDDMHEVDVAALEQKLIEAGAGWAEAVQAALPNANLPGSGWLRRYRNAYPAAYRERHTGAEGVNDIPRVERALKGETVFWFYRRPGQSESELSFKIFHTGGAIALSDVLPMLENRGLRVLTEIPFKIRPQGESEAVWVHDFDLTSVDGSPINVETARDRFHASFAATWSSAAEDDGFNKLILAAGLDWREIAMLRAYGKYLKQIGFTYSQALIEQTLAKHAGIAALLVKMFHLRFNPKTSDDTKARGVLVEIEHALDAVSVLDEDRILRRYINVLQATLRSNFYQTTPEGGPKSYISFKIESGAVEDLPKPRPLYEVWVYSVEVEAIHLRGGKVARGGIRWSDRREDFRTEILGLMKAQTVKNAVIVPVGSKGGFVVKRPPAAEAGRAAIQAHGIECYKTLMRGLLDITDNRVEGDIVPPPNVVRHDADDPYLVVAADKGTATFSDIANGISRDYGFWLDDAFASGGSAGYDHKALGITAKGAWIAVERHLREAGIDLSKDQITVVGIGDMAGDVFGNGLIHSPNLRLVGAFNHLHIFVDPNPDAASSFVERKRLFTTPGTTWMDYDKSLMSKGGAIYDRSAKTIKLSPEIQELYGLSRDTVPPSELIQAMLRAQVDLIWFGGIGTYIKATEETHLQAGDRANDALRVDGREIRAKVIGEGANLGVTQKGRLEVASNGGRINTDAIDNSAGVDCSDHEVNIKILLSEPVQKGDLDIPSRDKLLASMADEVCHLVLRDNYLQTFAMSSAQHEGHEFVETARRMMVRLEKEVALDRVLESLPTNAELDQRRAASLPMWRPELAVLIAWAKIALYNSLLPSDLPDDAVLKGDLAAYFPGPLQTGYADTINRHGLKREIIATSLTNEILNRGGMGLITELAADTGMAPPRLARAYVLARELFGLPAIWAGIEALDGKVEAKVQLDFYVAIQKALANAIRWLVGQKLPSDITEALAAMSGPIGRLRDGIQRGEGPLEGPAGVPVDLAASVMRFVRLVGTLNVLGLAEAAGVPVEEAGSVYQQVGQRFGFETVRAVAASLPTGDGWARQATAGLLDDLARGQQTIAIKAIRHDGGVEGLVAENLDAVKLIDGLTIDLANGPATLARVTVVERALRSLTA